MRPRDLEAETVYYTLNASAPHRLRIGSDPSRDAENCGLVAPPVLRVGNLTMDRSSTTLTFRTPFHKNGESSYALFFSSEEPEDTLGSPGDLWFIPTGATVRAVYNHRLAAKQVARMNNFKGKMYVKEPEKWVEVSRTTDKNFEISHPDEWKYLLDTGAMWWRNKARVRENHVRANKKEKAMGGSREHPETSEFLFQLRTCQPPDSSYKKNL